jgi:hypothetical protein
LSFIIARGPCLNSPLQYPSACTLEISFNLIAPSLAIASPEPFPSKKM